HRVRYVVETESAAERGSRAAETSFREAVAHDSDLKDFGCSAAPLEVACMEITPYGRCEAECAKIVEAHPLADEPFRFGDARQGRLPAARDRESTEGPAACIELDIGAISDVQRRAVDVAVRDDG